METRANHIWVGAVTLALLLALAAFIVWVARLDTASQKEYDIFFQQSVSGLAKGSGVSFAGVPAGQVADIQLWERDPEFVRVRIKVDPDLPILVGTTATIQATFTGVSSILLDGARADQPEISCDTTACPEGAPVIPPKAGGLGEILSNAPLLLERLATLTERLTVLLSDQNQASIAGILANTERLTDSLADASPQIEATLTELQATLRQANNSLAAFEKVTDSTDQLLNKEGASLAKELRATLGAARSAAETLDASLQDARPVARQLSDNTLPSAEAAMRDLRATSAALRALTERIENQGAGALVGGPKLPDYEP